MDHDLGNLARQVCCNTMDDFERAVLQPPHSILPIDLMVHHMRSQVRAMGDVGQSSPKVAERAR